MRKFFLVLVAVWILACPQSPADCIVQLKGQSSCSANSPGVSTLTNAQIPAGATWAPFIPFNNDLTVGDYSITGGSGSVPGILMYISGGFQVPDLPGAINAINTDPTVVPIITQLAPYISILQQYNGASPQPTQAFWAAMKSQQSSWLTPTINAAIEADCNANGVILNPSNP